MPFIRPEARAATTQVDARKIFVGRVHEIGFFVQHTLRPEYPAYNIVAISGNGGVGKTTLLKRFLREAQAPEFKDYCLLALVDEEQATPASMMEAFAAQFARQGYPLARFEDVLARYKETLRKVQADREAGREATVRRVTDYAGSAVSEVPLAGEVLKDGMKAASDYLWHVHHTRRLVKDTERLEDSLGDLTKAFVEDVNRLSSEEVRLPGSRERRLRRVLLFFDTFEQLAPEAAPWLLDYFLPSDLNPNVVLIIAGRDPIERSTPDDPKRWLPYLDDSTICAIPLDSFSEEETRNYLSQRGITDPERISTIWQLSHGLPLYLGLLTSSVNGHVDPTKDVVANFLRWIPEQAHVERQLALDAALFSKPFNQDDLAAFDYIPEAERANLYHWLISLPFVRSSLQDGQHTYHELARELFSRHLYRLSRNRCEATRTALANYYRAHRQALEEAEGAAVYYNPEWLTLVLALATQLFFLPDDISRTEAITCILTAYMHSKQDSEVMRVLREIAPDQIGNPAPPSSRQVAAQLLRYVETPFGSADFLTATDYLLATLTEKEAFSPKLLAHLYAGRGETHRLHKNLTHALADLNQAIAHDPDSVWFYNSRGEVYNMLRDYTPAIADFDAAIRRDPKSVWAYSSRGQIYGSRKEYQKAIADLNMAVTLDPTSARAHSGRGETYRLLKDYPHALVDLDMAISLDPALSGAYSSRGEIYRQLKEYTRALTDFDKAIELHPASAWAYSRRGETYRQLKEYARALADFDKAIELTPHDALLYVERGDIHQAHRDYVRAIADYTHALHLHPKLPAAYRARAQAHLHMHDVQEANADLALSLELHPPDPATMLLVTWVALCQHPATEDMAEQLERVALENPHALDAHLCQGLALWLQGRPTEALRAFALSTAVHPDDSAGYFWEGMAYAVLKQEADARIAIERALAAGLAPVLLTPLRVYQHIAPHFYTTYAAPLLRHSNAQGEPALAGRAFG